MKDFANPGEANLDAYNLSIKSGSLPFDDSEFQGEEGVFTRMNTKNDRPQMPGQRWNRTRTTLYNPKDSDPRVEAIRGEKRYKAKDDPLSANAMRHTLEDQQATIKSLQKQIDMMAAAITGKQEENNVQEVADVSKLSFIEKRKLAKVKGLSVPRGTKDEELTEILENAEV
jgi:hypothetical protein